MDTHQDRVEELFNQAIDYPPEQREAYLNGACGQDANLRQKVDTLLQAHDDSDQFLPDAPTLAESNPISEKSGTLIGRYKLLQQIGEGGMGVVFMAEQTEPVRRKVALKIIKLGMDTKSVVARFEAERQALALMDHPNIAKVLDAGSTDTGRPYFVMELVKGVPINTYCDKNHLGTQERLELFAQVCRSIQHAHQKGVIHRDIKPGNILVTLHDGKPVPKVIDFGIAKATNQRLTEKTLFTNFAQMIGTPAYMSPEQAEMSGLDVDTRTDVYSLGVLLYELLTGTTPFPEKELLSKGYGEMQRIIAEQEPDRPSLRMSTLVGEQQTIVTKSRVGDLPLLTKQLRGDLDWIVMKALEKDRTRRYETANGMAEDVQRHLNNESVEAAAPSLLYPFRKFYRRHRKAVLAALFVMGGFYIAGAFAAYQAVRAKNAEQQANLARDAEIRVSKLHQEERDRAIIAEAEARQGEIEAQKLAESRRVQAYIGDIMSAKVAIDDNDYPLARRRLLAQQPGEGESDLRGFEWRFLWEWCQDRSVASTTTDAVGYNRTLAISPNSRWAATANKKGIQIWSLPDLRSVTTVKTGTEDLNQLKFSPNSAYLLAEGDTEMVRHSLTDGRTRAASRTKMLIVDTDTWKETSSIPEATFPIVFLSENELLVSQSHYFEPGNEIPSERSQTVVSGGSREETVYEMKRRVLRGRLIDGIWSDPTEWEMPDPSNPYLRPRTITRVFETAGLVAFPKRWGTMAIWDLANDELLGEYAGHYTFDLDSHRRVLAVGNHNGSQIDPGGRLISLETGDETHLDTPAGSILSILRFEPHSQRLVGLDEAGRLFVWDGTDGQLLGEIENHYGAINGIDTIANHLVCAYRNGRLAVLDLDERKPTPFRKESIPFLRYPAGKPTMWTTANLADPQVLEHIQPGLRRLYEDRVIPWELPSELWSHRDLPPTVHLDLSPNGRFLAVQTREDNRFRVYDLSDNNRIVREDVATAFNAGGLTIGLSNANKQFIYLDNNRALYPRGNYYELWNLESGDQKTLALPSDSIMLSPPRFSDSFRTSHSIASHNDLLIFQRSGHRNSESHFVVWDLGEDTIRVEFDHTGWGVSSLSPDGSLALLRESNSSVYETKTGTIRYQLHTDDHSTWLFAPDGKSIYTPASPERGGKAIFWNAATGRELMRFDPARLFDEKITFDNFTLDGNGLYGWRFSVPNKDPQLDSGEVQLILLPTLEEIDAKIESELARRE